MQGSVIDLLYLGHGLIKRIILRMIKLELLWEKVKSHIKTERKVEIKSYDNPILKRAGIITSEQIQPKAKTNYNKYSHET